MAKLFQFNFLSIDPLKNFRSNTIKEGINFGLTGDIFIRSEYNKNLGCLFMSCTDKDILKELIIEGNKLMGNLYDADFYANFSNCHEGLAHTCYWDSAIEKSRGQFDIIGKLRSLGYKDSGVDKNIENLHICSNNILHNTFDSSNQSKVKRMNMF